MGDPRNPARAKELWNPVRLEVLFKVLICFTGCILHQDK